MVIDSKPYFVVVISGEKPLPITRPNYYNAIIAIARIYSEVEGKGVLFKSDLPEPNDSIARLVLLSETDAQKLAEMYKQSTFNYKQVDVRPINPKDSWEMSIS